MEKITAKQYAEHVGKSPSLITKRLQKEMKLPGIASIEKFGNTWVITPVEGMTKSKLKKLFENN